MRLENKVALISGGARGMGAEEARLFAHEGAKVVIGDVLTEEGRATEALINEAGGQCVFVQLDVTNESDWESAVATAISRFGRLDILVNNAGISVREGIEDLTEAQWERTMDINVKGVFLQRHPRIHPRHARIRRRFHHQHLVRRRHCARSRHVRRLRHQQGRRPPVHQIHRHPVRRRGNPLQLRASGPGANPHAGRYP